VAVDAAGNAYVTGFTDSPDFPVTNSIPGGVPGLSILQTSAAYWIKVLAIIRLTPS